MRALYLSPLTVQDSYLLKDDSLHHLVNVVRIEKGDEILLLNGEGLKVLTEVKELSKKSVELKMISHSVGPNALKMDLAIGMPKREALELSLKQAVELGFGTIYLVRSEYSQMKFLEADRMHKLLVSALEQSNAPFLPKIVETTWDQIPYESYKEAILFDSRPTGSLSEVEKELNHLLIVGPEGGFSPNEHKAFEEVKNLKSLNLPTPILRTPTAIATGAGIMIRGLLK